MASGILGELDRLQAEGGREKVRDVIVVTLVSDCLVCFSPRGPLGVRSANFQDWRGCRSELSVTSLIGSPPDHPLNRTRCSVKDPAVSFIGSANESYRWSGWQRYASSDEATLRHQTASPPQAGVSSNHDTQHTYIWVSHCLGQWPSGYLYLTGEEVPAAMTQNLGQTWCQLHGNPPQLPFFHGKHLGYQLYK